MNLRAQQIVRAVADASERWQDADFPARVRATRAIVRRTGYTEPVVDYALDALFGSIERDSLTAAIAGELGALDALDGFVRRTGRPEVFFAPVGEVAIVSSDTTIGVAIAPMIFALCAKNRVKVKDRDDDLIGAFAATIAAEQPELGRQMTVTTWTGADPFAGRQLADADAVVAYGRTETLAAIRGVLRPEARFVPFGHRTSVGYVARECLDDPAAARACAREIAIDALLYDGEGCLSVHAAFVERGASVEPGEFARLVAAAFDEVAVEFPAGYRALDAATAAYARQASFRAAQGEGVVLGGTTAPHLVVLDPPEDQPPPFERRTLALYAVDGPGDALTFLRRHSIPLEAVGTCGASRPDIVAFAVDAGAARLARLGALQRPPLGGEHGGIGRILPFVRAIYQ